MTNVAEQSEDRPSIEQGLVADAIAVTRDVNVNLGGMIHRTDSVIRRQNLLLVICMLVMVGIAIQIFLGLSLQAILQASRAQLTNLEATRTDVQARLMQVSKSVDSLELRAVETQKKLQASPTITSDRSGRLNLEVSVPPTKSSPTNAVERIVIPLKTAQPYTTK